MKTLGSRLCFYGTISYSLKSCQIYFCLEEDSILHQFCIGTLFKIPVNVHTVVWLISKSCQLRHPEVFVYSESIYRNS